MEENLLESFPYIMQDIVTRRWSTLASLVVLLYEYAITLNNEASRIWKRPFTIVRLIYIFSRYLGIISQIANTYLIFGPFSGALVKSTCIKWFGAQMFVACALMAALDIILMFRVYALHRRDLRTGILLSVLFCGQIGIHAILGPGSVIYPPYDCICNALEPPRAVTAFAVSICIKYTSLVVLIAFKYNLLRLRAPIVNLVLGDSAIALLVVCVMWATLLPSSLNKEVGPGHIIFGWPSTIMSVSCCRLIMNLQRLDIDDSDPERNTDELTSLQFELQLDEALHSAQ